MSRFLWFTVYMYTGSMTVDLVFFANLCKTVVIHLKLTRFAKVLQKF